MNNLQATLAAEWLHYDKAVSVTPTKWDVFDFDGNKVGEIFAVLPYDGDPVEARTCGLQAEHL